VDAGGYVSPALFGFVVNNQADSHPDLPFGTWRLWDDGSAWPYLQPDGGAFDFTGLDHWLAPIQAGLDAGTVKDVLYTFMRVPSWAATTADQYNPSNGGDAGPITCNYDTDVGGTRQCYPMKDLAWDGGGPDLLWRTAVAKIGAHIYQGLPPGTPLYWGLWDEIARSTTLTTDLPPCQPGDDCTRAWEGSFDQLLRAYQDASCLLNGRAQKVLATGETCAQVQQTVGLSGPVAPGSYLMAPSAVAGPNGFSVVQQFLYCNVPADAGIAPCSNGNAGAQLVDGLNVELYIKENGLKAGQAEPNPVESSFADYFQLIGDAGYFEPSELAKPLISSEGSWGSSIQPDAGFGPYREAFIARYYLMAATYGVVSATWYAFDEPAIGGLYDPKAGVPLDGAAGWSGIYGWLAGATLTTPCANVAQSYWTCGLTLADGTPALVAWDVGSTCDSTACTSTPVPVPAGGGYLYYRDLEGNKTAITGGKVPLSLQPILLTPN